MKKTGLKIILGIIASTFIMGLLFYLFVFFNPLRIYESNTLKWIPILIAIISVYVSGRINKDTPAKFLPLLFIPFIIYKLFNFLYFPFILILFLIGALTLFVTRNHKKSIFNILGWMGIVTIFFFFLFSQPLILGKEGFGYDDKGEIINAYIAWGSERKTNFKLPSHILYSEKNSAFDIANIKGETYLITFWATWCVPCLEEKPELEKFKRESGNSNKVKFMDISFDTDKDKWIQYLEHEKPLGMQLISGDQQKTSREFNFAGIPMHLIVHADGSYKKYNALEVVKKIITKTNK